MKKVLFLTNIPSPYRVNFFNEFGKFVDLTVLFEISNSVERDKSWENCRFERFKGIVMKGRRMGLDRAFCPSVIKLLKQDNYDYIFVCTIASVTGLMAVIWLRLHGIPYIYEGDGGKAGSKYGLRALWKKFIIGSAALCLSTSKCFDNYCRTYGAKVNKIIRYPFSSVYKRDVQSFILDDREKAQLKKKIGMEECHVIISVGRVIHLKGFDILLKAYGDILKDDWVLYIVGGSCKDEFQEIIDTNKITHVKFVEFLLPEELRNYYLASDFFVLPTRYDPWGLVINEAMAAGLPVITTCECGAGSEMVKNGQNGYLYHCEDINSLKKYMEKLMYNEKMRIDMGYKSLETARKYTIEAMAEKHLRILDI